MSTGGGALFGRGSNSDFHTRKVVSAIWLNLKEMDEMNEMWPEKVCSPQAAQALRHMQQTSSFRLRAAWR